MASPDSSSTAPTERPALRERTDSEANRHETSIRMVPYSPPKPVEHDEVVVPKTPKTPTRTRPSATSSHGSAPPSPTWPTTVSQAQTPKAGVVSGRRVGSMSEASASTASLAPATQPASSYSGSHSPGLAPSPTTTSSSQFEQRPVTPRSPSSRMLAKSRRSNIIEVNPDNKTFQIVLKSTRRSGEDNSGTGKAWAAPSVSSSHEEPTFDVSHDDVAETPLSSVLENSPGPSPRASIAESATDDGELSSSGASRMTGGLRKVSSTPEPQQRSEEDTDDLVDVELPLSSQDAAPAASDNQRLPVDASFSSQGTEPSFEEPNLQILGQSSPVLPYSDSIVASPAPSECNVQILGQSSPVAPSSPVHAAAVLDTPGSQNYVVHNVATPLSPFGAMHTPFREPAALESPGSWNIVVHDKDTPASQIFTPQTEMTSLETPGSRNFVVHGPVSRQSSIGTLGTFPRYQPSVESIANMMRGRDSQESLRISLPSTRRNSTQDRLEYSRQNPHARAASYSSISSVIHRDPSAQNMNQDASPEPSSQIAWTGPFGPRQWSSQLSTVMSEDERSQGSRLASQMSDGSTSQYSKPLLSASSMSLTVEDARAAGAQSRMDVERPSPAFLPSPVIRTIRDHDEHGDGIADLEEPAHPLRRKASWTKVSGYLARRSSDRRSSTSSRSNSITASSIPAWAKVYYGSGERKWLAAPSLKTEPSIQTLSNVSEDRRVSFAGSDSPEPEEAQQHIHNPRRRAREAPGRGGPLPALQTKQAPAIKPTYRHRKRSSSVWSPHLRVDRRSTLYSIWGPPKIPRTVVAKSGMLSSRNRQIVLFVVGFLFPFAWMIAAFLPLPVPMHLRGNNPDDSRTRLGGAADEKVSGGLHFAYDDAYYHSARWWRNLNRVMSIVGILVLGAVVALAVIGVKNKWHS